MTHPTLRPALTSLVFAALLGIACAAVPAESSDSTVRAGASKASPPSGSKERIRYGDDASQFGDLSVPTGPGPHPVVVLVHGGCWLSDYDLGYLEPLAEALNREGYATWNIEYRRLGASRGGWPQTFVDAGMALDQLRSLAPAHRLDLNRIVTVGHSSGGQIALWLGERARLPVDSEIRGKAPLRLRAAIGLAAITNLQNYRIGPAGSCNSAVDELLGGSPSQKPQRYAQTSPAQLLPPSLPQWLIQGTGDTIVPVDGVALYAKAAGARTHLVRLPGDHFTLVKPQGAAWNALLAALHEALSN